MAIRKACSVRTSVKNTGKECDTAMVATAMLIAVPRSLTFTQTDLDDPIPWIEELIHQRRAFPLFGQAAPIRTINNNPEEDIEVTLDDGTKVFLRYGIYNRSFETTSGGFCYAKALASFLNSGYSLIEIDQLGQMLVRKNDDGTYGGLIVDTMNAPAPIMADFTNTPYKNRFKYSFSPTELVNNGVIFEGATALLSKMGLIDSDFFEAAAASTTKLKVGLRTECAEADLIDLIGAPLADLTNIIVTNKATGAVVTPSAIAIVAGILEITGTYSSGQTYNVIGTDPETWYDNEIEGYDASETGSAGVDILIP